MKKGVFIKMEKVINKVTLEDGIEYIIVDEINSDSVKYVFLSNIDDSDDFCIRKVVLENNEEILTGLNDDAEFDLALMLYAKNHQEELEKIS